MNIVSGLSNQLPRRLLKKMFRYRYEVFIKTLGWELNHRNGMETDQFDCPNTLYVIAQDERGRINGCARLLPTDGPYLLGELFPQLLKGLPPPRSSKIWELSRFAAVDFHSKTTSALAQFSSPVAIQLLQESISFAVARGAQRLITVSPMGVERLLRRAGFHAHRAGPPVKHNGSAIFACWIETKKRTQRRSKTTDEVETRVHISPRTSSLYQ